VISVMTPRSELLVDVATLTVELAGDHPPVLIDVRWSLAGPPGIEAYRAGHLPGARFADLDTELAGRRGAGGRHPLPEPADFEGLMRRLGVSSDSAVVVYDAADGVPAARAGGSGAARAASRMILAIPSRPTSIRRSRASSGTPISGSAALAKRASSLPCPELPHITRAKS